METKTTQYLFFIIEGEKYAINAKYVQEIVDFISITEVPRSNKAIRGVINIRGELIAVIDPKVRFDISKTDIQKRTAFVVLQIQNKAKNKNLPVAIMVDLVVEVEDIEQDNILSTPQFGTKIDNRYIENIIRYEEEYISVLNVETTLSISELSKNEI